MRKALVGFTLVQLALVILQFYLATFGAFERPTPAVGAEGAAIGWHAMNGTIAIPAISLLTTIMAAIARAPGRIILLSAVPLLAALVQIMVLFPLAGMAGSTETKTNTGGLVVLGFHAIVGVAMLWAAVVAFRGAQAHDKAAPGAKTTEAV